MRREKNLSTEDHFQVVGFLVFLNQTMAIGKQYEAKFTIIDEILIE